MGLLQEFAKINKLWPSSTFKIDYAPITKLEMFELGYFAASDVPFRCFSIKLNPGEDHLKDVALLYNAATKTFISLLNQADGLAISVFNADEANGKAQLDVIQSNLTTHKTQLAQKPGSSAEEKSEGIRDQITKCILVERKVDEAMHFALSKELNRRVYFAIGECRERAALIPVFQNSTGADLVQLALHKWMDFALRLPQDEPFPEERTTGLVKNFLQIKKWLKDLITKQLAGISTLKEEVKVD